MTKKMSSKDRKQQILETIAIMLKQGQTAKITTANIAQKINISEATLYRHFANKEAMFLELITFAEQSVFGLINQINESSYSEIIKIEQILNSLLKFAEQNPGIIYLVINAESIGQSKKLGNHTRQFFRRLESQFKQNLQLLANQTKCNLDYLSISNLLQAFVLGKWQQFVFTDFNGLPTKYFQSQWRIIKRNFE